MFTVRQLFFSVTYSSVLLAAASVPGAAQAGVNPENIVLMELKDGTVTIELYPELAPEHVKRIRLLTRKGFYDGLPFHRVLDGFMVQTGDPTGTGAGGSKF